MASINFYGANFNTIIGGSGIGWYTDAHGQSVAVGAWANKCYITDSNGVQQGPEIYNMIYSSATGVILGQAGEPITLREVPNYQCTLNIRFTNDTAVKVQNAKFRITDRDAINNGPSGVLARAFSCQHYYPTQEYALGSGDTNWTTPVGSSVVLDLPDSPGVSGASINNSDHQDTQHDFFIGLACSPSVIGSRLFQGYVSLEYL